MKFFSTSEIFSSIIYAVLSGTLFGCIYKSSECLIILIKKTLFLILDSFDLSSNFTIIKFEEIKIVVNTDFSNIKYMIIAPLAIKAENVTMENVEFSGTIEFKKVPNCTIETVIDNFWYKQTGDISVDSNTVINFTDITTSETSLD